MGSKAALPSAGQPAQVYCRTGSTAYNLSGALCGRQAHKYPHSKRVLPYQYVMMCVA